MQLDCCFGKLFHPVGGDHSAYDVFVSVFIKHAAIGIQVHFARSVHHFCESHAVMTHPFRIELYLVFFNIATQYGHLRHTAGRKEARADRPVCYGA